jgi:hypothetical protein
LYQRQHAFFLTAAAAIDSRISFTTNAGADRECCAEMHSDSGTLSDGALIRAIQALAGPIIARATDSGKMVAPRPLAMAALKVLEDSISPITLAASLRTAMASST